MVTKSQHHSNAEQHNLVNNQMQALLSKSFQLTFSSNKAEILYQPFIQLCIITQITTITIYKDNKVLHSMISLKDAADQNPSDADLKSSRIMIL